ncbi:2-iminoacetate synthase ThiH [Actinobacillus pleuropneumoniae]|uniref:2-iminoacetate synthase n=1 Tax=Actinobacillus pleuropneumoniae TaxID=715 RepID=A0A3S4YIQ0_ACTPL|nr:2-iminoacetate synthase ThiH [Actinobacillus pleuropneumoniae]EFL79139.1 thiazole biosynthesis protein ThiH [Actinobacillus pleuropneumoniae serovar 2 str. 4226]EFM88166.1 Thiazole biosynthesis protein thiH [Actinobacillus pleuropneumoniae serovar 2 str. S1536]MEE3618485.1 2-iminoacetate synthase ThiH [Actinobacillus pleuropneumoniae]UKH08816.1 2-iminoacetate synthase ThiH [Actinobacillus pleuropneumoniae]UKH45253.1 2-iminoacetate synthase ThiH [Actinobacillus pleuropneumoniae serovar 2 str
MKTNQFAHFSDYWQRLDWGHLALSLRAKTSADVENALQSSNRDLNDFMALISPATEAYLEPMAQLAQQLTRQRFGNMVGFYLPLYLSNVCTNDCTYCGFSMSNRIKREILDEQEILNEIKAIKSMGYEHLLLVTGEHETKVGMAYFREKLKLIRPHFSTLLMEVQPLQSEEYAELKTLGLDGVLVYQETYNAAEYAKHHLRGQKQDFIYRLDSQDRLGQAGIDKIGLGALIGLSNDWRTDIYFVGEHLNYLQNKYWQSRYSISFPRLRPCVGGLQPASQMSDKQLLQIICAFRLCFPEVELSLSTRESANFRNNVIPIAINTISAGSKTQPGGYADEDDKHLEQFSPDDERPPQIIAAELVKRGLQPVWKDWEPYLGRTLS